MPSKKLKKYREHCEKITPLDCARVFTNDRNFKIKLEFKLVELGNSLREQYSELSWWDKLWCITKPPDPSYGGGAADRKLFEFLRKQM